ncbi:plasmid mobilization protein [Spirosoma luteolum]
MRLSQQERKALKMLSQQSDISVSQLLRTGVLGQLDQLPRFRQLPPEVTAQLGKLDRLTTALWYISQRAGEDAVYAQDIRAIVYEAGEISVQVRQFCQASLVRHATLAQLDALIENGQQLTLPEVLDQLQQVSESFKRHSPK